MSAGQAAERNPAARSAPAHRNVSAPARSTVRATPPQDRRASATQTNRNSQARVRVASRTHQRTSVARIQAQPRMRDAPHELIPVIGPDMRAGMPSGDTSPRAACLAATRRAEEVHGLPQGLLTAIALAESGLHAYALSIGGRAHFPETESAARALYSGAPAGRSIMAGCVQVNARVHARNSYWPLDPVRSADWAGGIMARWAAETGSWSEALRRWHGGSPASTRRLVCRVRAKMEVTNPRSTLFDDYQCDSSQAERTRRNGAAHLATAERQTRLALAEHQSR
ncbi:hypothetical protein [Roseococcus pinisoli]|uniref:Transglycosylase SLT domain-containing protein n=1 Tax=Roseococcus pinisoli TaxID=2835040 RepID=A0ABS5QDA8_9PROT|nr:hypothetical protein [Roseococcus pinisoli]MBS7811680.1 hypothetical protein [Roseococcus pinisoli]